MKTSLLPARLALLLAAVAAPVLFAAETRSVPGINLSLVKVARGTFTMGDPPAANGSIGDSGPQTKVTLTRDFWLGATEVTVGQWRHFTNATGYITDAERSGEGIWISTLEEKPDPSYFGSQKREKRVKVAGTSWRQPGFATTDAHPVVGISWTDAQQFCRWLTEREQTSGRVPAGYVYRLPTEAQWEYAATTAGQPDPSNPGEYSWYRANSGGAPHPVGTKKPNAWGLFDMQGNAWEWVFDWYGRYPGGEVTDYQGPASANAREIIRPHRERRGGWANDPEGHGISTTNRWSSWGQDECNWVGFRVALAPVLTQAAPPPPPPAAKGH